MLFATESRLHACISPACSKSTKLFGRPGCYHIQHRAQSVEADRESDEIQTNSTGHTSSVAFNIYASSASMQPGNPEYSIYMLDPRNYILCIQCGST